MVDSFFPGLTLPGSVGLFLDVLNITEGGWPTVAEVQVRLSEAGVTTPSDATIQRAIDACVRAWENATGWKPFLNASATVTTRRFSPRRRALLDIGGIVAAPTSVIMGQSFNNLGVAQGGTSLVGWRDYVPCPENALADERPYTHLRYVCGGYGGYGVFWGGYDNVALSSTIGDYGTLPGSVAVTAPFGYCTAVPADVWEAVMRCVLSMALPSALLASTGGLKSWKETEAEEEYMTGKDSPFLAVTDYFERYEQTILSYYRKRRVV